MFGVTTQILSRRVLLFFPATIFGTLLFWFYFMSASSSLTSQFLLPHNSGLSLPSDPSMTGSLINPIAKYFIDYPFAGPEYGGVFGKLGQRVQILTNWITLADANATNSVSNRLIEQASLSMFPFLRNPTKPQNHNHLATLRSSYVPGSIGVVIPTGEGNFRYACHLVYSIRVVLHSTIPIQIAFSGNSDLSPASRNIISSIVPDIEFLDVLSVLDDESMKLDRSWAIKPFAVLASKFEQVILVDADAVFLQPPENLLKHSGYQGTGTLLFHDRLLWQHAFQERHDWWKSQVEHQKPSEALLKSLVWTEDYAEEGDSGVVVLHKGKLPVFTALLHICWQNTKVVREDTTYRMTYGDKESWWFGLELCGVPHTFEKHYGAVLGVIREQDNRRDVCGFTIAHLDEKDRLIWYNGSLLTNKAVDKTTFEVPSYWMVDAEWEKGATKNDLSCMRGGNVRDVTKEEKEVLQRMVEGARNIDTEKSLAR